MVGRGGVPATGVGAVVLNLTAVNQTSNTFLTVWPTGSLRPLASNLNPNPGIIQPNLVIAKVGTDGNVSIYNNAGTVDLIADVQGPLTPIFQVGGCDERAHPAGGLLTRFDQVGYERTATIHQYSLGVRAMEIDLSHLQPRSVGRLP